MPLKVMVLVNFMHNHPKCWQDINEKSHENLSLGMPMSEYRANVVTDKIYHGVCL
jgi:hypothetical protein